MMGLEAHTRRWFRIHRGGCPASPQWRVSGVCRRSGWYKRQHAQCHPSVRQEDLSCLQLGTCSSSCRRGAAVDCVCADLRLRQRVRTETTPPLALFTASDFSFADRLR